MGTRINDEKIAQDLESEVKQQIAGLPAPPEIASLEPAATPDMALIESACSRVGIALTRVKVSIEESLGVLDSMNRDDTVAGILINGIGVPADPQRLRDRIVPQKDVAGAGPMNAGRALAGRDGMYPVEPFWPVVAAEQAQLNLWGTRATVLGRGDFLSRTLAMILVDRRATTTYVDVNHGAPFDLSDADIVFAAAGKHKIVTTESLKEGCVVIEIRPGDVDPAAWDKTTQYLPAPDPVSPIAIALLLRSTLQTQG